VKKHLGAPEILMVPKTSIGAFTGASFREHVKDAAAESSASDDPVKHQSNAPEQCHEQTKLQHWNL